MILVLDDVPGVIVTFGVTLRRLGIPFHGAESIAEAKALLPRHHWTGFVLDLELPDGNGVELLEWLRTQPAFCETPAVVITANILIDDSLAARVAGSRASLHCGAFTRADVEMICRKLLGSPTGDGAQGL